MKKLIQNTVKKILPLLIISSFLLTYSGNNAYAEVKDIFPEIPYYNKVMTLYEKDVVPPNVCFKPYKPLRRGELVNWLYKSFELEENLNTDEFIDLREGDLYYSEIKTLKANNLIGGYSDSSFKPYLPVTRAGFIKMLVNVAQFKNPNFLPDNELDMSFVYSDIELDHPLESQLSAFYSTKNVHGIRLMSGYSDGTFKLYEQVNKLTGARILYDVLEVYDLFGNEIRPEEFMTIFDNYSGGFDFENYQAESIGYSAENRPLTALSIGKGCNITLIVAAMHGDEGNTKNLADKIHLDIINKLHDLKPNNQVIMVSLANPDGLERETRFNFNNVDLNRNFNDGWQAETFLSNQTFPSGGGSYPFSEPEARALRDLIVLSEPDEIISYHSAASLVVPNSLERSHELATKYADISGYTYSGDLSNNGFSYEITGTLEGWAGSIGIPAIVVELENRDDDDFERNIDAIWDLLNN